MKFFLRIDWNFHFWKIDVQNTPANVLNFVPRFVSTRSVLPLPAASPVVSPPLKVTDGLQEAPQFVSLSVASSLIDAGTAANSISFYEKHDQVFQYMSECAFIEIQRIPI